MSVLPQSLRRIGASILLAIGSLAIAAELYVLADLRGFEVQPLWALAGPSGLAVAVFVNVGLVLLLVRAARVAYSGERRGVLGGLAERALIVLWGVMVAWLLEWTFLERPISVRVADASLSNLSARQAAEAALQWAKSRGDLAALAEPAGRTDEVRLAVMLARIAANRQGAYAAAPIGGTIRKYAERYGVDPIGLLHLAYIGSFWGEAVAGPMPFARAMTGETLRDVVQVHLPWWFVESSARLGLIEGDLLERVAGAELGRKLRYALQKATYEVSAETYDTNVFTDILLVLKEYPEEFDDVLGGGAVRSALGRAFVALGDAALKQPYHAPYAHSRVGGEYYAGARDDLISFARAAYYKVLLDFDFATRVHALVARYYGERYRNVLGDETWSGVSRVQKLALLAMIRDVHTTYIGRPSYNAYILPEFFLLSADYVAQEAERDRAGVTDAARIWRPPGYEQLWGGATFRLRVMGEVWEVVTGEKFRGEPVPDTISDALKVLARNRGWMLTQPQMGP